jgi:hypothetical protein
VKPERSVLIHGVLLLSAALVAFSVWTRKEPPLGAQDRKVQVWAGSAEEVERVEWQGKLKVQLEGRKDKVGRYYVGTVEKTVQVVAAGKLAESLAPLKAFRALGKLEDARAAEFGFKEPAGTVKVTLGGKLHTLIVGGATPGGADRYAKEGETSLVFAIPGDLVRTLDYADSRMLERELHHFQEKEITRVRIGKQDRSREVVAVEGKRSAWANPSSPGTQDETVGNWMSKLDTMGISEFSEQPPKPLAPDALVVKVDYYSGSKPRGYLELYKIPGEDGKPDYLVRTEYLRWYGKLRRGAADQIEQDLASVLK